MTLSLRTPRKQLRGSPLLLLGGIPKPALHVGAQVAPEVSVEGQFPGPPLVGGRLALLQGIV